MWETHAEADPVLNYKYLCIIYHINDFLIKYLKKIFFLLVCSGHQSKGTQVLQSDGTNGLFQNVL